MKVQTKEIFHCLACGHVTHVTNQTAAPECCGLIMSLAFKERTAIGLKKMILDDYEDEEPELSVLPFRVAYSKS
jgi:hypothetical protein